MWQVPTRKLSGYDSDEEVTDVRYGTCPQCNKEMVLVATISYRVDEKTCKKCIWDMDFWNKRHLRGDITTGNRRRFQRYESRQRRVMPQLVAQEQKRAKEKEEWVKSLGLSFISL